MSAGSAIAAQKAVNNILSMQERAIFIDNITQKRVSQLLPR